MNGVNPGDGRQSAGGGGEDSQRGGAMGNSGRRGCFSPKAVGCLKPCK